MVGGRGTADKGHGRRSEGITRRIGQPCPYDLLVFEV
jgi:hypothetical protein